MELDCSHTGKLKRTPSDVSIPSGVSADSGYDVEEGGEEKNSPIEATSLHPYGSDSGEEMTWSEQDEPLTGNYMARSESAANMSSFFTPITPKTQRLTSVVKYR